MSKRLTKEEKELRAKEKAEKAQAKADKAAAKLAKSNKEPKGPKVAGKPVAAKPEVKVQLPVHDNLRVLKVLESGHTKTHFYCQMERGITMHVPKHKFNV